MAITSSPASTACLTTSAWWRPGRLSEESMLWRWENLRSRPPPG